MNPLKIIKKLYNLNLNLLNAKRFILNERISLGECKEIVREGMARREDNFLLVIKDRIYAYNKSPYLKLLKLSRISYEDIEKMVSREGIEGALRILKEEGIYITYEEFKGKKNIKRKGDSFSFSQKDFVDPFNKGLGEVYGGASMGSATSMQWTSEYVMQKAVHLAVALEAHGCLDAPLALWLPTLPSQIGLAPFILQKIGVEPKAWFSQTKMFPLEPLAYKVFFTLNNIRSRRAHVCNKIPFKYVGLQDAHIIAEWAAQTIKDCMVCSIRTFVSGAVRICVAAKERNLDIRNTTFIVSSEPLTERRRKEIEECGCKIIHTYSATEPGFIGCSCDHNSGQAGDVHFFKDSFAIIKYSRWVDSIGQIVEPFLFTSLYRGCPFVMLNMELGDYGVIEKKQCGCLLESYGFDDHIYNIRSHEKITAEGMKCNINDILSIIDSKFPKEFGGASIDYQFVEEEIEHGLRKLAIFVSPRIKDLDKERMRQVLFDSISANAHRDMRIKIWQQVDLLEIKRGYPYTTERGKTPFYYKKLISHGLGL